jgi:DNA-damage-inducible protein J
MANIRVANDIKKEADFKFAEVGLTTSIAVQMFLLKFIKTGKFPFEIKVPEYTPNAETLAAFAETEEMLRTGNFGKCYNDAESMLNDILSDEE